MPVFHIHSDADTYSRAHTAHWLRRIGLHLDYLLGPATENWQAVPDWLTEYFQLPEPPKKIPSSDTGSRRRWLMKQLEGIDIPEPPSSGHLWQNIYWLSERLQLSLDERLLVTFSLCAFEHQPLRHVMTEIETDGITDAYRKLACILELPESNIRRALASQGKLPRLGFMSHRRSARCLKDLIEPDEFLTEALCVPYRSEEAFMQYFAQPEPASALALSDFDHLKLEADMILRTVRSAITANPIGVNVLLYGAPGSGKTELARVIAKELDLSLYGVGCENVNNGETATGNERLGAYQIAQHMMASRGKALVLFDEAEDVFVHESFLHSEDSSIDYSKAWMNRLLETNPVPTIWICNRIGQIDPAYRRRFDLVLRMNVLPKATRKRLIESKLQRHQLSAPLQETLASLPELLPYHLEKLDKVLSRIRDDGGNAAAGGDAGPPMASADRIAGIWLRENASLFDVNPKRFKPYADGSAEALNSYRLRFDWRYFGLLRKERAWLDTLLQCKAPPPCAVLVSGPEGAGKSELAEQLGHHFNVSVLSRSMADILNWQPGETERQLLAAFHTAEHLDAILVLEGIDTYATILAAVDVAGHQLAQNVIHTLADCLATFDGMVIATAREPKRMDGKILRRFSFHLELSPMSPEQNKTLFEALCGHQILEQYPLVKASLGTLSLVPSDYAEALKQMRLHEMGFTYSVEQQHEPCASADKPVRWIDPRWLLSQMKVQSAARTSASA